MMTMAATGRPVPDRPVRLSIWPTTMIGAAITTIDTRVRPIANRTRNWRLTFRHGNSPTGGQGSSCGHHLGLGRG